ncbi:MAG: hypothetical protein HZA07_00870 [Nitrospirae bacterium]|nr:hypothetical protein [Nitrospirota bacterium]
MKLLLSLLVILFFSIAAFSTEKDNFHFKKQPEIQQVKPKKPVKIKLKRSAEGKYTWELTGDDVDEVVKTDRQLRKMLNIK